MKIVRRLSPNNDYTFGLGTANFTSGIESVAQMIRTKLLLLRGEWWADILDGLPVVQDIMNTYNTEMASIAAASLCSERILEVDGVTSIENVEVQSNSADRIISVRMTVNTEYGQLEQVVEI